MQAPPEEHSQSRPVSAPCVCSAVLARLLMHIEAFASAFCRQLACALLRSPRCACRAAGAAGERLQPAAGPRSRFASGALSPARQWRIACTAWNSVSGAHRSPSAVGLVRAAAGLPGTLLPTRSLSRGGVCRGWRSHQPVMREQDGRHVSCTTMVLAKWCTYMLLRGAQPAHWKRFLYHSKMY